MLAFQRLITAVMVVWAALIVLLLAAVVNLLVRITRDRIRRRKDPDDGEDEDNGDI